MKKKILSLASITLAMITGCQEPVEAPSALLPTPTPQQVNWQKMETYAFVHFGMNTFNNKEWGYGDAKLESFCPSRLDCEQWVQTFVKAGMKGVIITAKHHDGFCLWPTEYTDYNISNTPYKDGKGDIVGELAAACKKYGIKFGVYLSPWDRNHKDYGKAEYLTYYYAQLNELLTKYGNLFEVWFDGANGGDGFYGGACETRQIDRANYYNYPKIWKTVKELQPDAIIFSDGGPDCRWVGNESGFAGTTNWSFLRGKEVYPGYPKNKELTSGHADGDQWTAAECDVSIRPGWFYHADQDDQVKSVEQLTDLYYRSVGHNATFLLNFPVDTNGLIHPTDSANAVNFHQNIKKELADNLLKGIIAEVTDVRGNKFDATAMTDDDYDSYWATSDSVMTATATFDFGKPTKMNRLLIQEYIPLGQRVKAFTIEYLNGELWLPIDTGEETTTIGYKRILRFKTIETQKFRIRFNDARGCLTINNVEAFNA